MYIKLLLFWSVKCFILYCCVIATGVGGVLISRRIWTSEQLLQQQPKIKSRQQCPWMSCFTRICPRCIPTTQHQTKGHFMQRLFQLKASFPRCSLIFIWTFDGQQLACQHVLNSSQHPKMSAFHSPKNILQHKKEKNVASSGVTINSIFLMHISLCDLACRCLVNQFSWLLVDNWYVDFYVMNDNFWDLMEYKFYKIFSYTCIIYMYH